MLTDTSSLPFESVGEYDLIEKIADGGMGGVYKGKHRSTGELVAIKVLPPKLTRDNAFLQRFKQEQEAAFRLDHPNIVRAIELGTARNVPYLVMEYVEGESLGAKLEREGRMDIIPAVRMISQIAHGLQFAHTAGFIHRDVKPDNILVTSLGTPKLTDLGLVKHVDSEANLTKTGRGLGTPHFMAPEQFRNAKNADTRCDVYSLGATLYVMVTGVLPFHANGPVETFKMKINNELKPPRGLVEDIPDRIDWAILRAMSADPERRPASCREFIEDLKGSQARRATNLDTEQSRELWYVSYRDGDGEQHLVRRAHAAICRLLREGGLGVESQVRLARSKDGPFKPVENHPEFRDVSSASPPKRAPQRSRQDQTFEHQPAEPNETPSLWSPPTHHQPTEPEEGLAWPIVVAILCAAAIAGLFLFQ